jgi:hypothetical protein
MSSERSGASQVTSMALTPPAVERGHSEKCDPAREKLAQQTRDMSLAPAMDRSRRRTHKNVAMLIGFNAMREFGERGISQYLGPTREIKLGLRFQVRQLDGDRHGLKVRQK